LKSSNQPIGLSTKLKEEISHCKQIESQERTNPVQKVYFLTDVWNELAKKSLGSRSHTYLNQYVKTRDPVA